MVNVLVIYFTQSGQLKEAVDATLRHWPMSPSIRLEYLQLKPEKAFPFPWGYMDFFSAFSENVMGIPCELEPFPEDKLSSADLIILAYQPWFLSISQPLNSFLQSRAAQNSMAGKHIVTIIACRNMWINAQEKMKQHLQKLRAQLVGNITYVDPSPNIISLITVMAFVLGGVKGRFLGLFPKYGVPEKVLADVAPVLGDILLKHTLSRDFSGMQMALNQKGAVKIKPNLMIMEGRGKILFPLYARFITKNGRASKREQQFRVRIFGIVLPVMIMVLSPIISLVAFILPMVIPDKMNRKMAYFSSNAYSA